MPVKELVKFIKEARKRGFDDYEIRSPLIKKGWPPEKIDGAFASLKPRIKFKNKITIYLDSDILKIIEKRAKKNIFTIPEQIEDILRRSCARGFKKTTQNEKIDDLLVSIFSRRKYSKK
jgi:hypothetical protein